MSSVPKRWRDSLLTTSSLLLPLSCIQDWQSPISFNGCKIHNCTWLHSLKIPHSLLKTHFTFFLPDSIFPWFFSKQKAWQEQSSDFIHVITAPKGATATELSHSNHYTKKQINKKTLQYKEFQPWRACSPSTIEETAGGCNWDRKPKVKVMLLAKRISSDTGHQLLRYCQFLAGNTAGVSNPPNWKGS